MEDKIEVGEYVKTKEGIIAQIKNIDYEADIYRFDRTIYINDFGMKNDVLYNNEMFKKVVVKHRKQLIDLIEVGDIVKDEYNKYEVAFVKDDKIYCNDYNLDDSLITLREQDIKAILTKEQMEDNCYKVGGEDGKRNIYRDTVTYNDNRANIIG